MERKEAHLLQGIDTIIIRVTDIEISKDWYEQRLGFTTVWYEQEMKLAVLDTHGPTSITLWETDGQMIVHRETATYPIFGTADASELRIELERREVRTDDLMKDNYVSYFYFYDPDGNVLEACQVHDS